MGKEVNEDVLDEATLNEGSADISESMGVTLDAGGSTGSDADGSEADVVEKSESGDDANETKVAGKSTASAATKAFPENSEYSPNYKFKTYDKEYEFDEFLRSAIKTKEDEEKLRDLYTKAYGLDDMKPKYESAKEYRERYDNLSKNLDVLGKYVETKDFGAFFDALKISDKDIMKWTLDRINYQEMSEEERRSYDANIEARRSAVNYQTQVQEMQSRIQEMETAQLRNELDNALNDPEINQIAKIYDERMGVAGSFQNAIITHGDNLYQQTGRVESPRKIALEIADGLKKIIGPLETNNAPQAPQGPRPSIPSIHSKPTSPAKRAFKSIADIEKYAQERYGV